MNGMVLGFVLGFEVLSHLPPWFWVNKIYSLYFWEFFSFKFKFLNWIYTVIDKFHHFDGTREHLERNLIDNQDEGERATNRPNWIKSNFQALFTLVPERTHLKIQNWLWIRLKTDKYASWHNNNFHRNPIDAWLYNNHCFFLIFPSKVLIFYSNLSPFSLALSPSWNLKSGLCRTSRFPSTRFCND